MSEPQHDSVDSVDPGDPQHPSLFETVSALQIILTGLTLFFLLQFALPFLAMVIPNDFGQIAAGWLVFMVLGPWALLRRHPDPVAKTLRLRSLRPAQVLWLLIIAVGLVFAVDWLGRLNGRLLPVSPAQEELMADLVPDGSLEWVLAVLALCLIVPLGEEMVFRGLIQQAARTGLRVGVAVFLCGALFAVFHFVPSFVLPLTLLGVVLGLALEYTGSLFASVLVHALYNAFVLVHQAFWYDPEAVEPVSFAYTTAGVAAILVGLWQLYSRSESTHVDAESAELTETGD